MNVAKLVWAAVSLAVSFGLNTQMHPRFVAAYEATESHEPVGTLKLSDESLEIPTLAAHVVVEDLVHLNKVYNVRELSLRSASAQGAVPSFELFAVLPGNLAVSPGRRPDPSVLLQLELAVQPSGRLGGRESFVQREAANAGLVLTGTFQFTDVRQVNDTGKPEWRGDARVELQVERERGVDLLTGRWSGPIRWE